MSLTSPPLCAGAAPTFGSPRIGLGPPAPGSNPTGSLIGSSLGFDRPPVPVAGSKALGLVSPGVSPGLVRPGVDRPGVVPDVRPGVRPGVAPGVRPGVVRPGVAPGVRPGVVRPGVVRPGDVRPGDVRPGDVRPGEVRPGEVRPGLARSGAPSPGTPRLLGLVAPVRLGIGGRLTPNCDNPCVSAPISSPGRSVMDAARTNSWCCGAGLAVKSQTAM